MMSVARVLARIRTRAIQLSLSHEAQASCWERSQVREDRVHVGVGNAEPAAHGGGVLVDRGGRHHGIAGKIRITERAHIHAYGRELAIHIFALYRAAHHKLMARPSVIGPVAIGIVRAREV
jgi:hypothetical protein